MPPAPAPARVDRLMHGRQHGGMLAHAEIVVGAPDRDLRCRRCGDAKARGKAAGEPLQIGEDAIAALGPQGVEPSLEELLVIHRPLAYRRNPGPSPGAGVCHRNDDPSPQVLWPLSVAAAVCYDAKPRSPRSRRAPCRSGGASRRSRRSVMISGGQKAIDVAERAHDQAVLLARARRGARRRPAWRSKGCLASSCRAPARWRR